MRVIDVQSNEFRFMFKEHDTARFNEIKDRVKSAGARFNPQGFWYVGITASSILEVVDITQSYSFVLTPEARDTVSKTADKTLDLLNLSTKQIEIDENFGLLKPMRSYQRIAAKYAITAGNTLIGDGRGVGKSVEAIAIVHSQKLYPCLILCKKKAKINWYREWMSWTDQRSISVWTNDTRGHAQVDILHHDMAPKVKDYIINYRKYKSVIGDESHAYADKTTARWKATKLIFDGIPHRYLLSGNIMVNSLKDLLAQLALLGRTDVLGSEWKALHDFTNATKKTIYIRGGQPKDIWEFKGLKNEKRLFTTLRSNCFIARELREVNDELPPLTEIYEDCPADSEQYRIKYNNAVSAMQDASDRLSGVREGSLAEKNILDEAEKNIFELRREIGWAKLPAQKEWLTDFLESGEKIILFAHHREVQEEVASWFPSITAVIKAGQTEVESQHNIDRFQQDPECKIISCSMMAGQDSVTLTAAHYMAILECPLTEKDNDQMRGRFERYGQQHAMALYRLFDMTENSVDRLMMDIVKMKKELGQVNSVKYFMSKLLA